MSNLNYHPSGEVKRETRTIDGDTYTLSTTYDGAGQIDTITYPSARVSQVTTTDPDGTETVLANQIERAPFGPIRLLTRGNGLTETRSLDQAYQVDVPCFLHRRGQLKPAAPLSPTPR